MNTIRRKFFEPLVTSSQRANRQAGPWKYLAWFIGSGDESQGRKKTSSKNPPIGEPLPWDSQRDIYVSMYINWSQENNSPPLWVFFSFFFPLPFHSASWNRLGVAFFKGPFPPASSKTKTCTKGETPGGGDSCDQCIFSYCYFFWQWCFLSFVLWVWKHDWVVFF